MEKPNLIDFNPEMGRTGELLKKKIQVGIEWAAGFIDGEGCISLIGDRGTYTAVINVGQVKVKPLVQLHRILGGTTGFTKDRFGGHYQWRVYGPAAASVAEMILPYLQTKDEQAKILLEYQKTKGKAGRKVSAEIRLLREALFEQMKSLNAKRTLDAERLNDLAPALQDDAIVRPYANKEHGTITEMIMAFDNEE